jgi:hypothetical protein
LCKTIPPEEGGNREKLFTEGNLSNLKIEEQDGIVKIGRKK